MSRMKEIREMADEGYDVLSADARWLISEVERLTKRCEEARRLIKIMPSSAHISWQDAGDAKKWLEGKP